MSPQPGEVWLADLGLAAKTRPFVIVPPKIRTRPELPLPRFPFLDRDSVANVQGLGSIPTFK
jgi:mRNA interferase MazF